MARDEIVSTKRNGRLPRGARVHAKGEKCEEACDLTKAKKTRVEKKKRKQSKGGPSGQPEEAANPSPTVATPSTRVQARIPEPLAQNPQSSDEPRQECRKLEGCRQLCTSRVAGPHAKNPGKHYWACPLHNWSHWVGDTGGDRLFQILGFDMHAFEHCGYTAGGYGNPSDHEEDSEAGGDD